MSRTKWQGLLAIMRFNWPYYAAALAMLPLAVFFAISAHALPLKILGLLMAAAAGYFLVVSSAVSHAIYDRSDLYRWRWLKKVLAGTKPEAAIFCHAGFDECSAALRETLPLKTWLVLDHYQPATMTEASIRRARKLFPPTADTVACPHDCWPMEDAAVDLVFGILAIHELRSESERGAWFSEARRCLRPGGRIILVEHLRDLANFFAFGPGFLHFHSRAAWQRSWMNAGCEVAEEFRVTPWINIFILRST